VKNNEKLYTLSEDSKFAYVRYAGMSVWSAYVLTIVLHTIFYLHVRIKVFTSKSLMDQLFNEEKNEGLKF